MQVFFMAFIKTTPPNTEGVFLLGGLSHVLWFMYSVAHPKQSHTEESKHTCCDAVSAIPDEARRTARARAAPAERCEGEMGMERQHLTTLLADRVRRLQRS